MATSKNGDDGTSSTIPTRTIHEAYREALQARRNYQQATGGPFEHDAHQALQDAVASYYEVLRPLLSSSNGTEELWNETELWPTEPVYQEVAICPECGLYVPADEMDEVGVEVGDYCPNCVRDNPERAGRPRLEPNQIPKTNGSGEVVYRYVEGLKSVDGIFDQRVERTVEYSDALGTHQETRVETQLVQPEHLKTIARKLDEALKALNLHAKVDDKLPKGTLEK
jgi:hypothetical protein